MDLAPGTCANVLDDDGGSDYLSGGVVTLITNMVTGERLSVTPAEPLRYTMLLGCYVLDDADYAAHTAGHHVPQDPGPMAPHFHADGEEHTHDHDHQHEHAHAR